MSRAGLTRIGVLTPHAAVGPEEEFAAMAPGRFLTRVLRVGRPRAQPADKAARAAGADQATRPG